MVMILMVMVIIIVLTIMMLIMVMTILNNRDCFFVWYITVNSFDSKNLKRKSQ